MSTLTGARRTGGAAHRFSQQHDSHLGQEGAHLFTRLPHRWPELDRRVVAAVAMLLFIIVFALRHSDSDAANAEGILFVVPIAMLALGFGLRGGLLGALASFALIVVWGQGELHGHLTVSGYLNRGLAFLLLGVLLGVFVDQRRRLEAETTRYYDSSLDMLATFDLSGRLMRVNRAWEQTLGHSAKVLCAASLDEFIHPEDWDVARTRFAALSVGDSASESVVGFRCRFRTSDGDYKWLEWSASASRSEGIINAVARDVTRLAAAERRLAENARSLETMIAERTSELDAARAEMLRRLAIAAEYRDDETFQHTERVGRVAARIGAELGFSLAQVRILRDAAPLHDVGKLAIPDAILLKPGKLSPEEFELMKTHTTRGAHLLSASSSPVLQRATTIALSHHERWDGSGYPRGLAGERIPLAGRVVAVADVFDALTHERPYKLAWPIDDAIAEIRRCSGTQFDPKVVAAFLRLCEDPTFRVLTSESEPHQSPGELTRPLDPILDHVDLGDPRIMLTPKARMTLSGA